MRIDPSPNENEYAGGAHHIRYEKMPEGWRLDHTWGSPVHGWIPICNGKSMLAGGRKGLLRYKEGGIDV